MIARQQYAKNNYEIIANKSKRSQSSNIALQHPSVEMPVPGEGHPGFKPNTSTERTSKISLGFLHNELRSMLVK